MPRIEIQAESSKLDMKRDFDFGEEERVFNPVPNWGRADHFVKALWSLVQLIGFVLGIVRMKEFEFYVSRWFDRFIYEATPNYQKEKWRDNKG